MMRVRSKSAAMKTKVQVGSALNLDSSKVKTLNTEQIRWEYNYVVGTPLTDYDKFLNNWKNKWGGNDLMNEAKSQFIDLGILNEN